MTFVGSILLNLASFLLLFCSFFFKWFSNGLCSVEHNLCAVLLHCFSFCLCSPTPFLLLCYFTCTLIIFGSVLFRLYYITTLLYHTIGFIFLPLLPSSFTIVILHTDHFRLQHSDSVLFRLCYITTLFYHTRFFIFLRLLSSHKRSDIEANYRNETKTF